MAAQPTIMNRMQNMPKPGVVPAPNPQFPAFASTQNLKNFWGDFTSGASHGLQGGVVGSIAGGAYNAFGGAGSAITGADAATTQTLSNPAANQFLAQTGARANAPGFLAGGIAAAQKYLPQAKQISGVLDQLQPQPNVPQAQLQKYATKTPQAQSGPQAIAQGPGGEQKPYFSFEKYFSGSPSMRALIPNPSKVAPADAAGMPQGPGQEDTGGPVPNNPQQQPVEQWGRPQGNGFWRSAKGYAFDAFNWLHDSPWAQKIAGGIAGGAATIFGGPIGALASPLVAGAAGGLLKGLSGQVRNFLAERTDMPGNVTNPAQAPQSPAMQQQPAILRTA